MKEGTNYARFYALLKKLKGADKGTLVYQFTGGRTVHLHLMTEAEYGTMCREMERVSGYDERREAMHRELKRWRCTCLKLMQQLGIDTTDRARVNDFCRDVRIAGKPFARISQPELEALSVKLRSIKHNGGLKAYGKPKTAPRQEYVILNMANIEKAN